MNKKRLVTLLSLGSFVVLSGCMSTESQIPVIGYDQNGNPTQVFIGNQDYTQRLQSVISTFQDSAVPVLNQKDADSGWMLRTLAIGVGTNMEIGIGNCKIGASPHFRLVFSNSKSTVLP